MQILIVVSLLSFLILVVMTVHKLWHIKTGVLEQPDEAHLVIPVVKAAQLHGLKLYARLRILLAPTITQAYKDALLLGYSVSASLAKRFAKLANQIKGRGELPKNRSAASFMLAYANKESVLEN